MQAVLNYIKDNKDRFISELCELLRIPSISAQPEHNGDMVRCAEWLKTHCQSIGLEAEVHATKRHPILVAKTPRAKNSKKPTYLVYGHYDVQPVDPLNLWKTPPFEPRIENGNIYGRGTTDDKGQLFFHLKAVEAYLKTGTELPCDLTFLLEGEEEIGSNSLEDFLKTHRKELACDAVVVSDTGMPSLETPALTYALRGLIAVEVKLEGPKQDLHSGLFGGTVDNPAMALCQLLGQLRDKNGHITIPGFYEGVAKTTAFERKQFDRLPLKEADYKKMTGVPEMFGERGFSVHERRSARPTAEINGLTSGYQGEGNKTIIPAWASAKLTFRLVPNQKPDVIRKHVMDHLKNICPPTVKLTIKTGHGGEPYIISPTSPLAKAALETLKEASGREPLAIRDGGSIPIVTQFKKTLKAETLLLGVALPDDGAHSPNEKFSLACFDLGLKMSALLWQKLGKI